MPRATERRCNCNTRHLTSGQIYRRAHLGLVKRVAEDARGDQHHRALGPALEHHQPRAHLQHAVHAHLRAQLQLTQTPHGYHYPIVLRAQPAALAAVPS